MPTARGRSPAAGTPAPSRAERQRAQPVKRHGVHYTPPDLARFLARRILAHLDQHGPLAVLDPACGDGALLRAVAEQSPPARQGALSLTGFDRDGAALALARRNLDGLPLASLSLRHADFLAPPVTGIGEQATPSTHTEQSGDTAIYDLVVANPPYVRAQVLGSAAARALAETYGLWGRIDLAHAFVRAATDRLRDGGLLGIICSNRFLSTQAGAALRDLLRDQYHLLEVFDLGDTRLFAASVLPAVVVARKRPGGAEQPARFVRVYEHRAADATPATVFPSVLAAVEQGHEGVVAAGGLRYRVESGAVATAGRRDEPWSLRSPASERWLDMVHRHTDRTFADIAPIRVGIKSTADPVFIRDDWQSLPPELQPEPALLRPLITHHHQGRWLIDPERLRHRVLYPYDATPSGRAPVSLAAYPRARAYLERHRAALSARTYLINGGRAWYELWVPQQPGAWAAPKLVFPDISETPRFALDRSGAVVNGDCYWIPLPASLPPATLALMLAVANSRFAVRFYDTVCGNRLYAGRRRFMTQYVRRFPIPNPDSAAARGIVTLLPRLLDAVAAAAPTVAALEQEIDALVWQAFGLPPE